MISGGQCSERGEHFKSIHRGRRLARGKGYIVAQFGDERGEKSNTRSLHVPKNIVEAGVFPQRTHEMNGKRLLWGNLLGSVVSNIAGNAVSNIANKGANNNQPQGGNHDNSKKGKFKRGLGKVLGIFGGG